VKIVLVIPTLKQGGAEKIMSDLANTWAVQGHDIHLILLAKSEIFYSMNKSISIYNLGFVNTGAVGEILSELKTFIKLRKLIKKIRPLFILSFMEKYNVFTLLASSFLNQNVFVSDRSSPRKKEPFSTRILRKITYRYASGIVAQTSLAKEILQADTKNKNISVIPNPLKNHRDILNIKKEKIIINVGRLIPEKGQEFLFKAFAAINNKDWKLVILGDGPLKTQLEVLARQLNIADKIYMPGTVKNVDEWLARSSIFAFTSVSEGFPNSLVEAMAAGLPCVSFDCDAGPKDIIENAKNGFLIPVGNTDKFSDILQQLIDDENLRFKIGINAKEIAARLDFNLITNNYLEFCTSNSR